MPRYFFDIHDGISVRDDDGTNLPDLEAARAHAMRTAATFTTKPGMLSERGGAVVVNVRGEDDRHLITVRLVFTIQDE